MMLENGEMYLLHVRAFVFVFLEGDLRAVIKFLSRRNLVNVTRNMNYMAVVHVSEGSKSLSF